MTLQGEKGVREVARRQGAHVVDVEEPVQYGGFEIPAGRTARHVYYLRWLQSHGSGYGLVLLADCADVAFQADPAETRMVRSVAPAQSFFFLEPKREGAYRDFRRRGRLCYSEELLDFVRPELLVSGGFWMGTPEGVAEVSRRVLLEAMHCGEFGGEEHYLNVVLQTAALQVRLLPEESLVGVVAKRNAASDFAVGRDFQVLKRPERRPFAVLSQYVSVPKVALALEARRGLLEEAPAVRRPRIYVYGDTATLNARLRDAYVPVIEKAAWTAMWTEFLAEVRIHEGLLAHEEWLTADPEKADVFFVPCYAWLAAQCSSREILMKGLDVCEVQRELMRRTMAMLHASRAWQDGRPHVIVHGSHRGLPEVFPFGVSELLQKSHVIVAALGGQNEDTRLQHYHAKDHDIVIPYLVPAEHVAHIDERLAEALSGEHWKPLQVVMHGSPNHPLRRRLEEALRADAELSMSVSLEQQDADSRRATLEANLNDAVNGTFCLAPRGLTASSRRIYEAALAACIPVVLGDSLTLAFQGVVPGLAEAAIFWPEGQVGELPQYLKSLSGDEVLRRQRLLLAWRYKYLLQPPLQVKWGGLESFILALGKSLGREYKMAAVPRLPATVRGEGPAKRVAQASVKGTAVLIMAAQEDGAEAGQIVHGLEVLLKSLRQVDATVEAFVLVSQELQGQISPGFCNATLLPMEEAHSYRGVELPTMPRFLIYQKTIQKHLLHFQHLIVLESWDGLFQGSLSELLGKLPGPRSVVAQQHLGTTQARNTWKSSAENCYKPAFYNKVPDTALVSAGVLAGAPISLVALSSLVLEEQMKCLSKRSLRETQPHLTALLWALHTGLLLHEDIEAVRFLGTAVLSCSPETQVELDTAFRSKFEQEGRKHQPALLLHLRQRPQLLLAGELRTAALPVQHPRLRICAREGMRHSSSGVDEAAALEAALSASWHDGVACDLWFLPLCGTPSGNESLAAWLAKFRDPVQHKAAQHIYVRPGNSCKARLEVAEVIALLEAGGARPIYAGGVVSEISGKILSGSPEPVLMPPILPQWEFKRSQELLAKALSSGKTELVLDVSPFGESRLEEAYAAMARSTFCLLPASATRWLVRAVLSLCVPVVQGGSLTLPLDGAFRQEDFTISWKPRSVDGLEEFLTRLPPQLLESMQRAAAQYRAALRADHASALEHALQHKEMRVREGRFAYFLMPVDDHCVAGLCRLLKSLSSVDTRHTVIAFLSDKTTPQSVAQLRLCGTGLPDLRFEHISPPSGMGLAWARLRSFERDEYERVLQLDADMLVQRNLDGLFHLKFPGLYAVPSCSSCEVFREPPREECLSMLRIGRPAAGWEDLRDLWARNGAKARKECRDELPPKAAYRSFNSGMLLFEPDREVYNAMQGRLLRGDYSEQNFLNSFFPDWRSLPAALNFQVGEATEKIPGELGGLEQVAVVHWPGKSKPWALNETLQSARWWFEGDDAGSSTPEVRKDILQQLGADGNCGQLQMVMIVTCAVSPNDAGYALWKSSIGWPESTSIRVRNVCQGQHLDENSSQVPRYLRALDELTPDELHQTLLIQADSGETLANYMGMALKDLISELVHRYQSLSASCDKVVLQADEICDVGRPCTLEEAQPFSLRSSLQQGKELLPGFPRAGLLLGRASSVRSLQRRLMAGDLHLGNQALLHAYAATWPQDVVLDGGQLLFGRLQAVRARGEKDGEECHAYSAGVDLGGLVCMSKAAGYVACCLTAVDPVSSLSGCRLWPPSLQSQHAPLFVQGSGAYRRGLRSLAGQLFAECRHHESMTRGTASRLVAVGHGMVMGRADGVADTGWPLTMLLALGILALVFRSQGAFAVCRTFIFAASLWAAMLAARLAACPKALLLSAAQSNVASGIAVALLLVRRRVGAHPLKLLPSRDQLHVILPAAFGLFAVRLSVPLLAASGAEGTVVLTSPFLCTCLLLIVYGRSFSPSRLGTAAAVLTGCAASSLAKLSGLSATDACLSFLVATGLSIATAGQAHAMAEHIDPSALFAWSLAPCTLSLNIWALLSDGLHELWHTMAALFLPCLGMAMLDLANLWLLRDLGAVASQLTALLVKALLLICGALVSHGQLTGLEASGLVIAVCGALLGSLGEEREPARKGPVSGRTACQRAASSASAFPSDVLVGAS